MAGSDVTLVTGASGFLGRHLVPRLVEAGRRVRILERRPTDAFDGLDVERVQGDVTDPISLAAAVDGAAVILHLAGVVSHLERDRARLMAVNVGGVEALVGAARAAGGPRVVHVSSVAAIGMASGPDARMDEGSPFPEAARRWPYALSKRLGEEAALRAAAAGLDLTIACPGFVIGYGDVNRVSTFAIEQYLRGTWRITVPGGLDYVDVRDVVEGVLLVEQKGVRGERYILGTEDGNLSHAELLERVAQVSGVRRRTLELPAALAVPGARLANALRLPIPPVRAEEVASGAYYWYMTSARAMRELGYAPRPADEAIAETVRWYREVGLRGR
jgi:dihydroflavonol-4-reductase